MYRDKRNRLCIKNNNSEIALKEDWFGNKKDWIVISYKIEGATKTITSGTHYTGEALPETSKESIAQIEKSGNEKEVQAIAELIERTKVGRIKGEREAITFLESKGIEAGKAEEMTSEIITQGRRMMRKSFSETVSALLKSLTGGNKEDDEEIKKGEEAENEKDDEQLIINLDDEDDGAEADAEEQEEADEAETKEEVDEDESEEDEEKEVAKNSSTVEGATVLKSLDYELSTMRKSMKALRKQNEDLGQAITNLAEMVCKIGEKKFLRNRLCQKACTEIAHYKRVCHKVDRQKRICTECNLF